MPDGFFFFFCEALAVLTDVQTCKFRSGYVIMKLSTFIRVTYPQCYTQSPPGYTSALHSSPPQHSDERMSSLFWITFAHPATLVG